MIEVVRAQDLQLGDVVHLHTDTGVVRIELTALTRRVSGFKCTGFRTDDVHRISPWSFGMSMDQPVEIDDRSDRPTPRPERRPGK